MVYYCKGVLLYINFMPAGCVMEKKLIEMSELYDIYGELLTQKQRDIFDSYYNNDLTLSEIADNEAITRQAVRDAVLRSEEILRDFEQKLHLAEHFRTLSRCCEDIKSAATEIGMLNKKNYYDQRILDAVKKIIACADELSEQNDDGNQSDQSE